MKTKKQIEDTIKIYVKNIENEKHPIDVERYRHYIAALKYVLKD